MLYPKFMTRLHVSMGALALFAFVATTAASQPACGGSESQMARPEDPRAKRRKKASAGEEAVAASTLKVPKERWEPIADHFTRYLSQKHTMPKDVFVPNAVKYIPRPAFKEDLNADVIDIEASMGDDVGPLQLYPSKEYRLLLIMSGTAVPKAVVQSPSGEAFVIQRDTRLGDNGGMVEAITQYTVVVREPDEEDLVRLTIQPPYVDLASQTAGALGGAARTWDAGFAVPPVGEGIGDK
jgi:Tfp pilus assembly protein PilP